MVDAVGIVVVLAFYLVVLIFGILITRWFNKKQLDGITSQEISLVAGRKIGAFVGIFTMTATTVGGGYINGTAESIATTGLAWTLAPFGIFLGMIIGGVVFAKKMREKRYLTMFDPFQDKYGHVMVTLLYLPSICGDLFWSASILSALGSSLSVIIDMNAALATIVSASITVVYVMFGQIVSVVYTDVVQLSFIVIGLVLSVPFAVTHPAVQSMDSSRTIWLGELDGHQGASWADLMVTMTLGTIPWQSYFQRILSAKTYRYAQILSISGAFGAFILGIPPALIGVVAVSTDWNQTSLGESPLDTGGASLVLPLVLKHLTPRAVSLIGLGAIAAAVISSIDSSILSSASIFTHNIYKVLLHKQASDTELLWVQRVAILVVGAVSTIMAIFVPSIIGLFILAADIVYVILFPQLLSVIFIPASNAYGSLFGLIVGVFLRLASGEPVLNLKPLLKYPYYNPDTNEQLFPFRTFAMICSLLVIVVVSYMTNFIIAKSNLSFRHDKFRCRKKEDGDVFETQLDHTSSKTMLANGGNIVYNDTQANDQDSVHDTKNHFRCTSGETEDTCHGFDSNTFIGHF